MHILVYIYESYAMLNNIFTHFGRISYNTARGYQLIINYKAQTCSIWFWELNPPSPTAKKFTVLHYYNSQILKFHYQKSKVVKFVGAAPRSVSVVDGSYF
jgi:hypothetical protein